MIYTRSLQARQMDQLREQLTAALTELEHTQKELEHARQLLTITKRDGNQAITIRHRKAKAECGTYAGYMRHVRHNEERCQPCKAACAIYYREYRARRNAA